MPTMNVIISLFQPYSGLCNKNNSNVLGVHWKSLAASPCSGYFDWSHNRSLSVTRNISVLKCDFTETDTALKEVQRFMDGARTQTVFHARVMSVLEDHYMFVLCHQVYQDCEIHPSRPTAEDCETVHSVYILRLLIYVYGRLARDVNNKCLPQLDCNRDFSKSSTSTLFSGLAVNTMYSYN